MSTATLSKFAQEFAKKAKARYKQTRAAVARQGSSFGPVDMPNGSYIAIISAKCELTKKATDKTPAGTPVVQLIATIAEGDHTGKEPSKTYWCTGESPRQYQGEDMPTNEELLAGDMKLLMPDLELEKSANPADLAVAAEVILNQRLPKARVVIRTREKDGKTYQDVFMNELLEAETVDAQEEEAQGQEGEEASQQGSDEEEVEQEAEGADDVEEPAAPAKGDVVLFKPKGYRKEVEAEVTKVDQRKQTVELTTPDGKKWPAIPWAQLTE